jgi:hypothetical protein
MAGYGLRPSNAIAQLQAFTYPVALLTPQSPWGIHPPPIGVLTARRANKVVS